MFNKKNKSTIYTGFNTNKIRKAYKNKLRKSWFSKNITPIVRNDSSFFGKIIKFFVKLILKITTPRINWKNKTKTSELINRAYEKFVSKEIVFIPISLSFYF